MDRSCVLTHVSPTRHNEIKADLYCIKEAFSDVNECGCDVGGVASTVVLTEYDTGERASTVDGLRRT